jgi:hypothetical protein
MRTISLKIGLAILLLSFLFGCEQEYKTQENNKPEKQKDSIVRTVPSKVKGRPFIETDSYSYDGKALKSSKRSSNKLGMWLWYIEGTGYDSHSALAEDLYAMGVKRIYVKVADNTNIWKECQDGKVPAAYKNAGLEVWAWSYNYPDNEYDQATALYYAAKAGYQGYVLDIEKEFDGTTTALHSIFQEFEDAKQEVINDGHATYDFPIYCTTWGNPKDHGMNVDIIDQYVDAHMPQTYVEVWGQNFMNNIGYWVDYGTQEYRDMGCDKPIHHIVSAEHNKITASQVNEFIEHSGPETSVWRIPGGGTSLDIWNDLENVNWGYNPYSENVTIECPSDIPVNESITFTGTASEGVDHIIAYMDQYKIGEASVNSGNYTLSNTFNTQGENRDLIIKGYNNDDSQVAETIKKVNVVNSTNSTITVHIPDKIVKGKKTTFSGTLSGNIEKIVAKVDGWEIKNMSVAGTQYSFTYTFNQTDTDRSLVISGYDGSDNMMAQSQKNIDVVESPYNVTINIPSEIVKGETVTFSGKASPEVSHVIVSVDGWEIKNQEVNHGEYSFDYTFNSTGNDRQLVVNAFSPEGTSLCQEKKSIDVIDHSKPYITDFPYFYQYNNSLSPASSCQNTAMAMVIKYYGGTSETPDQITEHYNIKPQQDVSGWESTFNSEASYFGLNVRDNGSETYTVQDMRDELAKNKPVVVHGYFTEGGHVMVVLGFDGSHYYVHDPAGEWSEQYGYGGYSGNNPTIGKYIKYSKDAFENAISPDGYVWMHKFYFTN